MQRKEYFQTNSPRPTLPWCQNQTKTNEHRGQNPQQNFSKPNSTTHRKYIHHDHVGFIPGMLEFFNIYRSINMIVHIYQLKGKMCMITKTEAEKNITFKNVKYYIKMKA